MQKFTKPQFHRCKTCQTSSFWGLSFKTPESQNWISRKICLAGQIAKFPHCANTMMMVLHSMSWNKLEVSRGGRGERINCSSGSVRSVVEVYLFHDFNMRPTDVRTETDLQRPSFRFKGRGRCRRGKQAQIRRKAEHYCGSIVCSKTRELCHYCECATSISSSLVQLFSC